jgi:hypothetical protein
MNKIAQLATATLSDIPRVLRAIADELEDGAYGHVVAGVVVLENVTGELETFGAGAATNHRAIALCAGAQQILIQSTYGSAK